MPKQLLFVICYLLFAPAMAQTIAAPRGTTVAAYSGQTAGRVANYMTPEAYNVMSPFMDSTMRKALNPGDTQYYPDPGTSWARAATGSGNTPNFQLSQTGSKTRQVVARGSVARAGAMTAGGVGAASTRGGTAAEQTSSGRRVVARSGRVGDTSTAPAATPNTVGSYSTNRCMSDYAACMNGYCERADTPYNKCYCSAQLAQIDAEYQPAINELTQKIVMLRASGTTDSATDAELEQIWGDTFGLSGANNLAGLNDAISGLSFLDTENRARGQAAFAAGNDYCGQILQGCFYAAENLRGAYRSQIATDCATYKRYLNAIKTVAENAVAVLEGQ